MAKKAEKIEIRWPATGAKAFVTEKSLQEWLDKGWEKA